MPSSLFGKTGSQITGSQIDQFFSGGNPASKLKETSSLVTGYLSPNNAEKAVNLLAPPSTDDQDSATKKAIQSILLSDASANDFSAVIDQVIAAPDTTRGDAYKTMQTAIIGGGQKTRTDIKGARSFINPLAIIHHASCKTENDFLDDERSGSGAYRKMVGNVDTRKLTIEGLLKDFPDTNDTRSARYSTPYRIGDFLYCKYFGKVPLNNMITLRRFAHPTYDNLQWGKYNNNSGLTSPTGVTGANLAKSNSKKTSQKSNITSVAESTYNDGIYNFKPIAQAVTFFGESTGNDLEKLTNIRGEIKWKKLESDVNKYEMDDRTGLRSAQDTPGAKLAIGGFSVATLAKGVSVLSGSGDIGRNKAVNDGNQINLFDAQWANKTYGPVDSITETNIRDRGVHATYKVELTFEFELRSIAGINPRIAMLDIIANMLALTFNNAKFWGGANIFFPNHPQFAFLGNQNDYYNGDYGKYLSSVFDQLGPSMGTGLDLLKSLGSAILNLDFKSVIGAIAGKTSALGIVGDLASAKSRPATMAVKSLLSGQPNGCWHLTVGNPYRPILKMGNLIVKDWEMNFSGFMGVDDFPSEMKYKVTLETCRPVDKGGVESWLNGIVDTLESGQGSGRLYYAAKEMNESVGKTLKDSMIIDEKGQPNVTEYNNSILVDQKGKSTVNAVKRQTEVFKNIVQAQGTLF